MGNGSGNPELAMLEAWLVIAKSEDEHMTCPEEEYLLALMEAADAGHLVVENRTAETFDEQYIGHIEFAITAPGGLVVVSVFNDCGSWDYLESVSWGGKVWVYPDTAPLARARMGTRLAAWRPRRGGIFALWEDDADPPC